jgi:hypothetical protein
MSILESVLQYGKKRKKQFFPEGIPGLYPLSKQESGSDVETMAVMLESSLNASPVFSEHKQSIFQWESTLFLCLFA